MPAPRFHLLPWSQPLPRQAAAWLAQGWAGGAPLDLREWLVITPTRQASRRLREALASHAATHGQAVLPPRMALPDDLLRFGMAESGVASHLESLLAWIETLRGADLNEFRDVFPADPPSRDFDWARRLAERLLRVQTMLAEGGWRMVDVVSHAGPDFPEAARWAVLAELERRCDAALAARGLRDAQAAKIAQSSRPALPPGITRIAVLAVPDPLPLAVRALAVLAGSVPVDVVAIGPDGEDAAALFDEWGRPCAEVWAHRPLDWADFEERVHLCADPAAQAGRIAGLAASYGDPSGALAIGVADPDVLPALSHGLRSAGLAPFDPEGTPRSRGALHALLAALAEMARSPSFDATAAFARCPAALAWLQAELGPGFSPAHFLAALDAVRERHLPLTLDDALRHVPAEIEPALSRIAGLRATLAADSFPAGAVAALERIFAAAEFDLTHHSSRVMADDAAAWRETLAEVAHAAMRFELAGSEERWALALGLFGEDRRFEEKPDGAIDLLGWLELLWEDAPHVVVSGCNDGHVPEAVVGDAFLPEALRVRLGLKTNASRFARDAYLLAALRAMRGGAGRLDLLVGKVSGKGDPLPPSRLLLQCADAALPQRARFLFRTVAMERPGLPWRRAWALQPRRLETPLARLSVTAFRDYLACPFRFYLKHGLRMAAVDPSKSELDARDFGDLCHAALQSLGENQALRDCTDEKTLREALLDGLADSVRKRYGSQLSLPLVVQLESARQRLRKAAAIQARERAEGWVIERVEWKFPETPDLSFSGIAVRGKIDRIDRHEGTGAVRVLDYKTSDRAAPPFAAHCRRARRDGADAGRPAWAVCSVGGQDYVWTDLQLPLYLRAAAPEFGVAAQCGYFNLPKAVGETEVSLWGDYSPEWQEAAMRCATGVAESVAAGAFWPPAELPARKDEDWAGLFHQGAAASVAWEGKP